MLQSERLGWPVAAGSRQVKENAHVLGLSVDYVGRDGEKDMHDSGQTAGTNVNLPLMLDSTSAEDWEAGLKVAGGKCILNSHQLRRCNERFFKVLELAKPLTGLRWGWDD